jgi:ParB family chromosome partitioning protein
VRETEARVAQAVAEAAQDEDSILKAMPRRRSSKTEQIAALERELKLALGTMVDISQTSRGRGRITVHFTSIEEFDRLRRLLSDTVPANLQNRKAA